MTKEKFKKQMLSEFKKQLSDFIDNAGHIGKITEVEKIYTGEFVFKYKNTLQNNAINEGKILIKMFN
jgi:hypothetical protein